jgi:(R)-2-hydroxyacyl-CoA dehydratese activating ATPase
MDYFCGIDIGASAAKLVVIDRQRRVVAKSMRRSGVDYAATAEQCLADAKKVSGTVFPKISAGPAQKGFLTPFPCVATGYGRDNVPWAGGRMTEIACHGKGAYFYFRRKITVIDIGAQDSKVIHLDERGHRTGFKMNRKCAAGTGAFLEEIAYRLDLPLADLNGLAERSTKELTLGSFCTVFAATEVLEKIRAGEKVEDIIQGAFRSVVKRILEMDALEGALVMTGGVVAHNPAFLKLVEQAFGQPALVPPDPQYAGALGAALFALENAEGEKGTVPFCAKHPPGRSGKRGQSPFPQERSTAVLIQDPPAQVADNLWLLGCYEYPVYLVRDGDEAALVEGGTSPVGPLVCEQLRRMEVPPEAVKYLVIPHAHPDHVMAIPMLREALPQAAVLASGAAAKTLANEKAIAAFCQIDDAIAASLREKGSGVFSGALPRPGVSRIAVDQTLKEGDTVTVGGLAFQVLETPGHSDCSLCFYQPQQKLLFSSDAAGYYMSDHDYWWPNYFVGYRPYLASIERLIALKAEILCQGHHGAIRGADEVEALLRAAVAATQQYHERIVAEIRAGKEVRALAEQLGAEVFEKTHLLPLEFFQKNCGLLVKQSLKVAEAAGDKG